MKKAEMATAGELEGEGSFESFLEWAAEIGVTDSPMTVHSKNPSSSCLGHSLSVCYFPQAGGRGLGAVRDLRKGELVLRVPKSALMTSESVMRDQRIYAAVNRHPCLSSTQILAVCLLYEMGKGKNSWWHPYLMHMPRDYDMLETFGEFEIQSLQVNDAVWAAERAVSKAEMEWKEAKGLLEELMLKPRLQTFRVWLWATATISSRTLHVPWDDAGCLCPVGDLFNYAAPGEEQYVTCNGDPTGKLDADQFQRLIDGGYEEDVDAYCFYAQRNYKTGDQVLLSYGTYTNLELLEHYGFFLNENPNDKAFILLEPEIYTSCSWPKETLYIDRNGKPSFALLCAMRLWATPPNQRRSVGHLAHSGAQLSPEIEITVMKWISKSCFSILATLPSSIEEDSELLSSVDKMLASKKVLSNITVGSEIHTFLEANSIQKWESEEMLLSRKATRSMERWKLAIGWRLMYKKILTDCISHCSDTVNSQLSFVCK